LSDINVLVKHLSENSDKLKNAAEKSMVCIFSPSCAFTDISCNGGLSSSYIATKESEVVVERKLLFLKEQMEYRLVCNNVQPMRQLLMFQSQKQSSFMIQLKSLVALGQSAYMNQILTFASQATCGIIHQKPF
jgi:hypothetical protein